MAARRNADEWTFSHHALSRAVDMALGPEEVRAAIESNNRPLPHGSRPGVHYLHTERITLTVNLSTREVITIQWNTFNGRGYTRWVRDTPEDIERCRDAS